MIGERQIALEPLEYFPMTGDHPQLILLAPIDGVRFTDLRDFRQDLVAERRRLG